MPYLLKNLPLDQDIRKFSSPYSNLDPVYIKIVLRLLKLGSTLDRQVELYFEKHQLSNSRFAILFLLFRLEPEMIKQTEMAQKLELSRASVTGFLNSLEEDSLIERVLCPGDKRAFHLRLTRKGREVVESLLPGHIENLGGFSQHLKREEIRQLENLLSKFMDAPTSQDLPLKKKRKNK